MPMAQTHSLKTLGGTDTEHAADYDCAAKHRLPATIASRCQRLTLRPPATADAVKWLQARLARRVMAARRWRWPAARRCWRWNWPAEGLAGIDADMSRSMAELADGTVDVTLARRALGKIQSGHCVSLGLRTGSHSAYTCGLGASAFASNCGTNPLACRFT